MRVRWLQHVAFEDLGCIAPWLAARGHEVHGTALHAGDEPPVVDAFDALIIMGGPMNVDEHERYPWLAREKQLIRGAIAAGKPVLGICLGAQLIAASLGAPVARNDQTEIGWFDVERLDAASPLLAGFPPRFSAFHWHGDTFAIPAGARHLMRSEACANQAFALGDRVLGLQFHLEVTAANAREMVAVERPIPARYVQDADAMLADLDRFAASNRLMQCLLGNWLGERT